MSGLEGERDGLRAERVRLMDEQARLEGHVCELQVPAACACLPRYLTACAADRWFDVCLGSRP